ncbi:MAG TPA: hypothetical protein DHV68_01470 [Dehalococcoidia bacterium]|nr:hypothetical protein [Dehalococcoidia bacterium]|tara:strand:- start:2599 stop:2712 length:114 start_codon:yes stop_codon:yes gene_type:complete
MNSPAIPITADLPVSEAAKIMLDRGVGPLVVVDPDGK